MARSRTKQHLPSSGEPRSKRQTGAAKISSTGPGEKSLARRATSRAQNKARANTDVEYEQGSSGTRRQPASRPGQSRRSSRSPRKDLLSVSEDVAAAPRRRK